LDVAGHSEGWGRGRLDSNTKAASGTLIYQGSEAVCIFIMRHSMSYDEKYFRNNFVLNRFKRLQAQRIGREGAKEKYFAICPQASEDKINYELIMHFSLGLQSPNNHQTGIEKLRYLCYNSITHHPYSDKWLTSFATFGSLFFRILYKL